MSSKTRWGWVGRAVTSLGGQVSTSGCRWGWRVERDGRVWLERIPEQAAACCQTLGWAWDLLRAGEALLRLGMFGPHKDGMAAERKEKNTGKFAKTRRV